MSDWRQTFTTVQVDELQKVKLTVFDIDGILAAQRKLAKIQEPYL